ncbi:alpha/beta fold hydrolase [Knoellia subterranea]|nr:alpha/beta hydrolase [Knoellia subterranea]
MHDDEGSGPAVVLLHAGVADRRMWRPLVPALSAAHRVVTPDLRGWGETPLPGGRYTDADDLAHLLDELGIDRATLVGASFGGRVALEFAAMHPDRVDTLVLLNPAYRGLEVTDPAIIEFDEQEDALLESGDIDGAVSLNVDLWLGPAATDEARVDLARMQRHAFEVQLAADELDPPPQPDRLEVDATQLHLPTTIVTGAHDATHFREVAALLTREIESSALVELDWAGHLPALERPVAVADLLLAHLDGRGVAPVV